MAKKKGFESSLKTLEEAVTRLEAGELDLEDALKTFEHGVRAAAECRKALEQAELQVEVLLKGQGDAFRREAFDE